MENCILKPYVSVIDNDNIDKFNELKFEVVNAKNNNLILTVVFNNGKTVNENVYASDGISLDFNTQHGFIYATGSGTISIKDKYNITTLVFRANVVMPDYNNFKYIPLTRFGVGAYQSLGTKIPLSFFTSLEQLSTLLLEGMSYGDVQELLPLKNTLTKLELYKNTFTGTTENLAKLLNLTSIEIKPSLITGSIENFVAVRRASPISQSSGSITFDSNSLITWQGESAQKGSVTLSWTSNTITYNGETISA